MKRISTLIVAVTFTSLSMLHPLHAATPSNPYGTSVIDPAGPNESILKISKKGKSVEFTLKKLKAMKSSEISIYEPFVKKRQKFTVIPLSALFKTVGISGKDLVETIALNDYIYSSTASKFVAANAYLAIAREGKDIPYSEGGPVRLVFADSSRWASNLDAWNWSLAKIVVK